MCKNVNNFRWGDFNPAPRRSGPQPGRGAAGIEIAPANEFHEFRTLDPSPASIFWKSS